MCGQTLTRKNPGTTANVTDMPKIPDCDRCRFYAHSPYMICGVNPCGPTGDECLDFDAIAPRGEPLEGGYYAGDWIPQLRTQITDEQQLALLDWHPLFTGRCPNCEMPIRETTPPRVHWDCHECGWMDDSV
ncbi:hypothetical protein Lepto7375DRAFT_0899 [Leptolyngbya sp. PCC 7375]|nr:hypothetical protein Lepto7375DRAFT_0899 [Leptolyngbya sp. PCC 7375]